MFQTYFPVELRKVPLAPSLAFIRTHDPVLITNGSMMLFQSQICFKRATKYMSTTIMHTAHPCSHGAVRFCSIHHPSSIHMIDKDVADCCSDLLMVVGRGVCPHHRNVLKPRGIYCTQDRSIRLIADFSVDSSSKAYDRQEH